MHVEDPFGPADATVLRPRPGAGRRAWGDPAVAVRSTAAAVAPGEEFGVPGTMQEPHGAGLTPLITAAVPLLLLAGQLRSSSSALDVGALRRHALEEIRRFEERARESGVAKEIMLAARYVLCAALDEAVLSTPWGAQSEWAQQTLLVTLHREAWGGEKFFEMLDRLSRDSGRHFELLELQYLCLVFGFAGKYQVDDRGYARLAEIQQKLYRTILSAREQPTTELSVRWRGVENRRNPVIRYVPWWVLGAGALAIVAVTFAVYYTRLGAAAAPVHAALAKVGTDAFNATAVPVSAGPRLKTLLAADEARGALIVEEDGGRTLITLGSGNVFGSGSATPGPEINQTLQDVAAALNQVPGRVLVVGHTDDQPLASLRYRDNFELSRERALAVVKLLQSAITNPARIEWTGAGPSQPRYRPESTPQNRARNRRVEIIHVRGA